MKKSRYSDEQIVRILREADKNPTTWLALMKRSSLAMLVVATGADLTLLTQHRYWPVDAVPVNASVLHVERSL